MDAVKLKGTRHIPSVIFDPVANIFELSGRSCPEDVSSFYRPLIDWLQEYTEKPNAETTFDFKLTYYNTASAKMLLNIMQKLEDLNAAGGKVKIRWYFPDDDEDLEEAGEDYADMVEVPIELISYPVEY